LAASPRRASGAGDGTVPGGAPGFPGRFTVGAPFCPSPSGDVPLPRLAIWPALWPRPSRRCNEGND
jgi:hypothetical protein